MNGSWLMNTFNPIFSAMYPIVLSRRSRRLQLTLALISTLHWSWTTAREERSAIPIVVLREEREKTLLNWWTRNRSEEWVLCYALIVRCWTVIRVSILLYPRDWKEKTGQKTQPMHRSPTLQPLYPSLGHTLPPFPPTDTRYPSQMCWITGDRNSAQ